MTDIQKLLVVGATGVVGYGAMKAAGEAGVPCVAVSRRTPDETYGATHVSLDLMDGVACEAFAEAHPDITHVAYAALYEKPGLVAGWLERDQIETNDRMLRNLMEPLQSAAQGLTHISFLQGTKAYGAHVRPIDIPARENRSEHEHENFYWLQEAYVREAAARNGWSWTIFRPQIIFGEALGAAMNLIPAIGAYAALLKADGEPLHFPGGAGAILEAVDADLLGRAILWAARSPEAANEIFNVTNGDVFVWRNVWPAIAAALGMEAGEDRPQPVADFLTQNGNRWRDLAVEQNLAEPDLAKLLGESHHYADFTMAYGVEGQVPAALVSTIKLRQAGFTEIMDTEAMFAKWFARLQEKNVLPSP